MITYDNLRALYLKDLENPDVFHGRSTPKVRNIKQWKDITPILTTGHQRKLDPLDEHGPKIYVWSDIHFFHKNIIKYCNRPYPSVALMNQCLIGNYLNVVNPEDVVIFGGDIGFGSEKEINEILYNLPGYKIQIVGNHDIHRDGTLYQLAFDETHLSLPVNVVGGEYDFQLLFTHYPMDNVPKRCVNVHGHIHNKLANSWNINMCVEHTNYAPLPLSNVIDRAKKYLDLYE